MQLTAITTAQHFIQAFSWMLIHSLWQGLLLSVIVGALLTAGKKASAAVRYNLVLVQLLLFVAACAGTFLWEWCKAPVQYTGIHFDATPATDTASSLKTFTNSCIAYFTANSPVIVLVWFIMFLVRTVRIMGSALFISRARHRFIYRPSDEWKAKVDMFCDKLQLKRAVQLLESGYVNIPMVIGHLKPVILIPIGLLAGLPAGQVEAVLLHELAHIRRNDYVVNCLQTIVETVFFFNPGLLWISSVLRDERENCCDDIALAQTKNKKEFVQALISFKEYALERKSYAVAFPGDKNSLLNRASRILYNQNKALGRGEKAFFLAGILVLFIVVGTASIAQMHTTRKLILKQDTVLKSRANTLTFKVDTFRRVSKTAPILHYDIKREKVKKPQHKTAQTGIQDFEKPVIRDQPVQKNNADEFQAKRDQAQAMKDQQQAIADQVQALKDQIQAKKDEEEAKKAQEAAARDQISARRDQDANKRDQQEDIDNKLAEQRNRDALIRNEQAVKRDQESDKRNQNVSVQDQPESDQQNSDRIKNDLSQAQYIEAKTKNKQVKSRFIEGQTKQNPVQIKQERAKAKMAEQIARQKKQEVTKDSSTNVDMSMRMDMKVQ